MTVFIAQPQLLLQETAASALHNLEPLRRADWQVQMVGEGKQEGPCCQATERALQVKEVSGTTSDVGAVVSYVCEELTMVRRTAQGLLVSIQDGNVAAVAGQRV